MRITDEAVYGLDPSIKASGFPMITDDDKLHGMELLDSDYARAGKLGHLPAGSGHPNFLKGIIMQFNLRAPLYFWKQAQRYHWFDIVSSQSTMHKILDMDIDSQCNEYVRSEVMNVLEYLIAKYKENPTQDNFQRIVANIPSGFEYTARISTNYLQLKTIYAQRRKHKLKEWQYFCDWCETLPLFHEIVI